METVDARTRTYIQPVRIVWQKNCVEAERLLTPREGQTSIGSPAGTYLPFGASIVFDFGKEIHGGVQLISCCGEAVSQIRLRFGESVSEVMGTPNNDHAVHDTVLDISKFGWLEYGNTGFRFVRIDKVDAGRDLELKEVRAVRLMRDLEYRGRFECNDPLLNTIWETGAYTTHLCMQDYVWDGIKRDRLVWMGDMHPEAVVAGMVFGQNEVIEKSLDLMRNQTPLPGHMNGIGSYSLWWIITHRDWYRMHGDLIYLQQQIPYLTELIDMIRNEMVDENGVEKMPGRRFLDWTTIGDEPALHAGLHALIVLALEAGADVARNTGEEKLRLVCENLLTKMRKYTAPEVSSKQVNALSVLAGLSDASAINQKYLAVDPLKGISTFYGYYVLQARAAAGDYEGCLELIRKYWGGMIELGATTFWEHFNIDWMENAGRIDQMPEEGKKDVHRECGEFCYQGLRHSLCHGWASGPTAWLMEHVLGITAVEAGGRKVRIASNLCDLEWAKGALPTRWGNLEVEHVKDGDTINTSVRAPDGVTYEIVSR